jgi:hypothetical protein
VGDSQDPEPLGIDNGNYLWVVDEKNLNSSTYYPETLVTYEYAPAASNILNSAALTAPFTEPFPEDQVLWYVPGFAIDTTASGDTLEHLWLLVAMYHESGLTPDGLVELSIYNDGSYTTYAVAPGGGIAAPQGIALDGAGDLWIANNGYALIEGSPPSACISEIQGAEGASPGTAVTPSIGYGREHFAMEGLTGIALDASGSVWVSTGGANVLTQFLGLAAPVQTPLIGPAKPI